jgi:hypothetical protein
LEARLSGIELEGTAMRWSAIARDWK